MPLKSLQLVCFSMFCLSSKPERGQPVSWLAILIDGQKDSRIELQAGSKEVTFRSFPLRKWRCLMSRCNANLMIAVGTIMSFTFRLLLSFPLSSTFSLSHSHSHSQPQPKSHSYFHSPILTLTLTFASTSTLTSTSTSNSNSAPTSTSTFTFFLLILSILFLHVVVYCEQPFSSTLNTGLCFITALLPPLILLLHRPLRRHISFPQNPTFTLYLSLPHQHEK